MKYPYMVKANGIIYKAGEEVPDTLSKPVEESKAEKPVAEEIAPKKRGRAVKAK